MFSRKSLAMTVGIALGALSAQHAIADAASGTIWLKWDAPAGSALSSASGNATGTITFNDWGLIGPGGRTANDFAAINGFGGPKEGNLLDPTGGIGQIQHVITRDPDWLTPEAPQNIIDDFNTPNDYANSNMDTITNFFEWGYASPGGSRFSNMLIDFDGDYLVKQESMRFEFYDYYDYKQEAPIDGVTVSATPDGRYITNLAFQPYPLSDGTGWCGSILAIHPGALEGMAGQITFDFAFDVYTQAPDGTLYYNSTEIVRGFEMSSYGDYVVDITNSAGVPTLFSSRAVVNNTNPTLNNDIADRTAPVDPNFYNLVSFAGAGIIPTTGGCGLVSDEWAAGQKGPGIYKYSRLLNEFTDATSCVAGGGEWQNSAFSGYAFILRADGIRVIEAVDYTEYPNTADAFLTDTDVDGNLVAYNYDDDGSRVTIADLARDTDGDGFTDVVYDNCTLVANDQLDTDADGYGNACDADFNNDNIVNVLDLGIFKTAFFNTGNVQEDINGDQIVNSLDLGLFKGMFFTAPGPSGVLR